MANDKESAEASIVFERLFSYYLGEKAGKGDISLHLKKIEKMADAIPMFKNISINADGQTSMDLRDWAVKDVVQTLSKVYDSMIDVSSITVGEEAAFEEAYDSVIRTRKQFESQFDSLGLNQTILKGALRDSLPTGIDGLDKSLNGGIPKGNCVLLLGPSGSEKYLFAYQFLAKGLRDGASCLATTSVTDAKGLKGNIAKLKVKTAPFETKGRLKIVDWYSHRKRNIVGVEEDGAVYLASKDIANLDIAINTAMNSLAFAPTRRAILDIVSPALSIYGMAPVIELLQREKARLEKNGFTTLIVVEKDAHDEQTISTLKNISSGVFVMNKTAKELSLQIESMSGTSFDSNPMNMKPTKKGLAVVARSLDEGEVLQDFTEIPAVTPDIARNMFEFGFTDIEKLEKAGTSELMEVAGIDENAAEQIYDYVNSVKYSQKLLTKNSRKWLKIGIEYIKNNKTEKAIQSFQRAIEIDAQNSAAWFELAKIILQEGNEEDARTCYEKAKSIDSGLSSSLFEAEEESISGKCSVCETVLDEERVSCTGCGVTFTVSERQKMWGK